MGLILLLVLTLMKLSIEDTHGEFIYNMVSGKDGIRTKCNKAVSNMLGKIAQRR